MDLCHVERRSPTALPSLVDAATSSEVVTWHVASICPIATRPHQRRYLHHRHGYLSSADRHQRVQHLRPRVKLHASLLHRHQTMTGRLDDLAGGKVGWLAGWQVGRLAGWLASAPLQRQGICLRVEAYQCHHLRARCPADASDVRWRVICGCGCATLWRCLSSLFKLHTHHQDVIFARAPS